MRRPEELTPDELATLTDLWHAHPNGVLAFHHRDHTKHDALVEDGYVTRTEYEQGVEYRMADEHAEGVGRVVQQNAEQADRN